MTDTPQIEQRTPTQRSLMEARRLWERIPTLLRFLLVAAVLAGILFATAYTLIDTADYQTLYAGLSTEDASAVVARLKEGHVAYRLGADGTTIQVPAESVHEIRLDMAANGLPAGGGLGYELFDQQKFGMTEFEEQIAMKRALEGELTRTISGIRAVKSARVHLVMPKRSVFRKDSTVPSASVVLDVRGVADLSETVVPAIIHLVSSSVENLDPENVTVVDTRGKLLSGSGKVGGGTGSMEVRQRFERDLEAKIEQMLAQTLGPDSSVVSVAGEFDFTTEETTEERYDPDRSVLRSEHRELETNGALTATAGGVPGSRSNLPGGEQPTGGSGTSSAKREVEIRNFEVDKLVRRTISPTARLKKISVAVLVDGRNSQGESFVPRGDEELSQIESAVRGAIGYDAARGDTVEVLSLPFKAPVDLGGEIAPIPNDVLWWWWIPVAGASAVIIALLAFIMLRRRGGEADQYLDMEALPLPSRVSELEAVISSGAIQGATDPRVERIGERRALVNHVRDIFTNEREGASRVLKAWISEAHADRAEEKGK